MFVKIKQINNKETALHSVNLLHLISLGASFHLYGVNHCRSTLSISFHYGMSLDDLNTPTAGGMIAGP